MLNVQIEKLVFGGMGLARTDSGVVFVPGVLPGETVSIEPQSKSGGVQNARLCSIEQSSADRRTPPCRYYGVCGGCDWLHIDYRRQPELKKQIFEDCFRRIGKFQTIPVVDFFESPEFNYRTRVQLKLDSNGRAGFYKRQSNDVIPLDSCPLLTAKLNSFFSRNYNDLSKKRVDSVKMIEGDTVVASDPVIAGDTKTETLITVHNRTFKVNGGDFFQSNRFVNPTMGKWAVPSLGGDLCVDLYGGCGFFSLMVADHYKKGLLIESVDSQVRKANVNFKENGVSHFTAVRSDVERCRSHCRGTPDLVIIDPPRPGLTPQAREAVAALKSKKILYVSCNVSTLARDSAFFVKNGYTIKHGALFDCYPNTSHLESALLFVSG